VRQLAGNLENQARAHEAISRANAGEATALDAAADQEKTRQAGLQEEWKKSEQTVKDLQTALESIGKGTAINIEGDAAKAVLDDITAKLAGIKDKTIVVRVVQQNESGKPLDNLTGTRPKVPGFASGGAIKGPGHATSDNLLILGSPGEYMLKAASVRHYGLPFIEAINSLRLPKFANGGLLSHALPIRPMGAAAQSTDRTVNINLDLGSLGRFPMQASHDVAGMLEQTLRMAALKRGGR